MILSAMISVERSIWKALKNFICVIPVSGMRFWEAEIWITAECMKIWFVSNCFAADVILLIN